MDLNKVKENLISKGYSVAVFETKQSATKYLNDEIDNVTVGIGGSVSVKEMDLFPALKQHNDVFWHNDPEQVSALGSRAIRNSAVSTDIYISSVNAMSEDGVIINIDGTGNRIASTAYGHKKVYLIVGVNKIAPDFDSALFRARNIASPKNAQRLGLKTPCAKKGDKCYDCNSPDRICRGFLIFERAMMNLPTEIILINENLGY